MISSRVPWNAKLFIAVSGLVRVFREIEKQKNGPSFVIRFDGIYETHTFVINYRQ